jgi:adenylate cyclase, class 2
MGQETEIKLRVGDLRAFRHALRELGARVISGGMGRVREWNAAFDTPEGALKRRGQLLRIRTEKAVGAGGRLRGKTQRVTLTLKSPMTGRRASAEGKARSLAHKVREEVEVQVSDGDALTKILEGLGMRVWFRYEKFRTTFRLPEKQRWAAGLLIELDETPIGTFVELEGAATAIDRAAKALGFSRRDYITANYFDLYRDECRRRGVEPSDMAFAKAK